MFPRAQLRGRTDGDKAVELSLLAYEPLEKECWSEESRIHCRDDMLITKLRHPAGLIESRGIYKDVNLRKVPYEHLHVFRKKRADVSDCKNEWVNAHGECLLGAARRVNGMSHETEASAELKAQARGAADDERIHTCSPYCPQGHYHIALIFHRTLKKSKST